MERKNQRGAVLGTPKNKKEIPGPRHLTKQKKGAV